MTNSPESVRLTNIPQNIQKRFNIGAEAIAEVSHDVVGGGFLLNNNEGQPIDIDAVELSGTKILVEKIQPKKE